MLRALFSRSRAAAPDSGSGRPERASVLEACPPQVFGAIAWSSRLGNWLGASGWRVSGVELPSAFGLGRRGDTLTAARLDFADALFDVRTASAASALDRIWTTRSLHELWHVRGEVFSHVALRHDQAEAARRLAVLDRHFARRALRAR
jgi:hypothetical protein